MQVKINSLTTFRCTTNIRLSHQWRLLSQRTLWVEHPRQIPHQHRVWTMPTAQGLWGSRHAWWVQRSDRWPEGTDLHRQEKRQQQFLEVARERINLKFMQVSSISIVYYTQIQGRNSYLILEPPPPLLYEHCEHKSISQICIFRRVGMPINRGSKAKVRGSSPNQKVWRG